MRRALLLSAALAAIPLTAFAQEQTAPATPTTPEQFHALREAKMAQGGRLLMAMKRVADSDRELNAAIGYIAALIAWSHELPTLFPEGSGGGDARPEIWSDPTGFAAAAARFQTAADALTAPALANDRPAFQTAWTQVQASCDGCHDSYRN